MTWTVYEKFRQPFFKTRVEILRGGGWLGSPFRHGSILRESDVHNFQIVQIPCTVLEKHYGADGLTPVGNHDFLGVPRPFAVGNSLCPIADIAPRLMSKTHVQVKFPGQDLGPDGNAVASSRKHGQAGADRPPPVGVGVNKLRVVARMAFLVRCGCI